MLQAHQHIMHIINRLNKSLDFKPVYIVNVDNMPFILEEDVKSEVSLINIAITRAEGKLFGRLGVYVYFDEVKEVRVN
jgi:hypothetical protein